MTFGPINTESPFLPTSLRFEEEQSTQRNQLATMYSSIAYRLNNREISLYGLEETTTGQKWTDSANLQVPKGSFRRVFEFGAIAAGATLLIPHGGTSFVRIVKWYGGFNTASRKRPLPFVSASTVTDQVQVDEDGGTNFVIVNGATAPDIVSGTLIVEFLKN